MKVLFVNTWGGGAIYNVFRPVYEGLKARGWEVGWQNIRDGQPIDPRGYDLVHFTYFMNMPQQRGQLEVPFTATVHHMHPQHVLAYMGRINSAGPVAVHTADPFCRRQLQQHSFPNVHVIPYTFDWAPFPLLPLPEEFTVGYLGCDYNTKRFDQIERAASLAGVKCVGIGRKTLNEEESFLPQQEITDLYSKISCYVVASYNDGGPLPPQEALLCGRPVATTHVGMMDQVIDRINGEFHDGSAKDMARAILKIRANIDSRRAYIEQFRSTMLPSTEKVLDKWEQFFEGAVA